jgi:hypothetical protein
MSESLATKRCPKCGETKPHDLFARNARHRDGLASWCKACTNAHWNARRADLAARGERDRSYFKTPAQTRNANTKWKYGITSAEFDAMLAAQGGCCAICGTDRPSGNGWHLDHDHAYAARDARGHRGVLCGRCNQAIGLFRENPDVMRRAIGYLDAAERRRLKLVHGGSP